MIIDETLQLPEQLKEWLVKNSIKPMNLPALITAFTHPSYKGMVPEVEDYERLEFLGDAVLDLVSAEELINESTDTEGVLTEKRKQLVNNDYLAKIFDRLKMGPLTRTALNYSYSIKDKANIVEAFFGALFLEHKYDYCKEVWQIFQRKMGINKKQVIKAPLTSEETQNRDELLQFYQTLGLTKKNAKSMLQELCQKQKLPIPTYKLLERKGPDHDPVFHVKVSGVFFQGPPLWNRHAIGEGKNKKEAEINAAEKLCNELYLEYIQ
jgi:ribonuclease III